MVSTLPLPTALGAGDTSCIVACPLSWSSSQILRRLWVGDVFGSLPKRGYCLSFPELSVLEPLSLELREGLTKLQGKDARRAGGQNRPLSSGPWQVIRGPGSLGEQRRHPQPTVREAELAGKVGAVLASCMEPGKMGVCLLGPGKRQLPEACWSVPRPSGSDLFCMSGS